MSALKKYYRKPSLFITLPSGGHFYDKTMFPENAFSSIGEVGVLPMTTMNELMIKNPESLINGTAVEELIKDATTLGDINVRKLVRNDIDALLIGIKIATQGDIQELELSCPKCKHEQVFNRDLKILLSNINPHEKEYVVNVDNMYIYLRPSTFEDVMILETQAFNEQKKIRQIQKSLAELTSQREIDEDEELKFLASIHNIFADLTISTVAVYTRCIIKIEVDSEVVTDQQEIYEWLKQTDTKTFSTIRDKIASINSLGLDKHEELCCSECEHRWLHPLDTNPTDFFATGS